LMPPLAAGHPGARRATLFLRRCHAYQVIGCTTV
jgi:hypothetical protein